MRSVGIGAEHEYVSHRFDAIASNLSQSRGLAAEEEDWQRLIQENADDYHICLSAARDAVLRTITKYAKIYLRSKQNQLTPINRLPTDIFSIIFEFAVPLRPDPWEAPLILAAVSRSWRRTVLEMPTLWARINGYTAQGFLSRVKSAPLDIEHGLRSAYPLKDLLPIITPYSDQWRIVDFSNLESNLPSLKDFATLPATALECLRIAGPAVGNLWRIARHPRMIIPANLFNGNTPRLRELDMSIHCIPLTSSIFSGLTRLRLAHIRFAEADGCPTYQLLRILSACPHLEEFFCGDIVSPTDLGGDMHPTIPTPIHLPSLRQFTLDRIKHTHITRLFLESITFPASLHMKLISAPFEVDNSTSELHDFYPFIPNLDLIHSARIELTSHWGVTGWDHDGNVLLELKYPPGLPMVPPRGPTSTDLATRLFNSLGERYSMPNVTALSVEIWNNSPVIMSQFIRIANSYQHLTDMWVTNDQLYPARALTRTADEFPCPTLRHLHLVDSSIKPKKLLNIIRSRVHHTDNQSSAVQGLCALTLVDCYAIDEGAITELKSLVPSVMTRGIWAPDDTRGLLPCGREYFFSEGIDASAVSLDDATTESSEEEDVSDTDRTDTDDSTESDTDCDTDSEDESEDEDEDEDSDDS
ncbi:hypothetical protein BOTBODRAFT_180499 [Botryobasidium botryosum FD-172 SS1]|uniref:F-box domain-containing protein n=1 Tax=Botryobasidium botryosum (strain FD-172 SS1) TaxID=930990 RepID=A0A067LWQ6_BOTB1|nr:hypothetical protein BOTBODRAFT_180499 [Botryobasidium botryosum FD-172 SS1]